MSTFVHRALFAKEGARLGQNQMWQSLLGNRALRSTPACLLEGGRAEWFHSGSKADPGEGWDREGRDRTQNGL